MTGPSIQQQALLDSADHDGIDKLVVGAIIHDHGRILILRRSNHDDFLPGIEELPSGGVEPGEDLLTALARELHEEIGRPASLDAAAIDNEFVASFDYRSNSGRATRQFTFALTHDGNPVRLSPEHTGFRWLTPDQLDSTDLTPETLAVLERWVGNGQL